MKRDRRPDLRPKWWDPNLPCTATHKTRGSIEIAPEVMQRAAQYRLKHDQVPTYRDDPTYNMRRKPKK